MHLSLLVLGAGSIRVASVAAASRVDRSWSILGVNAIERHAALCLDLGGSWKVDTRCLLTNCGIGRNRRQLWADTTVAQGSSTVEDRWHVWAVKC